MSGPSYLAAVDLGASSGRVVLGILDAGSLRTEVVHRFANEPVTLWTDAGPHLYWNAPALFDEIRHGLRQAHHRAGCLDGIGIDTWAVDYGLLDDEGALLGLPYNYRDSRTDDVPARFFEQSVPARELYGICGLQVQPFNTVFQVAAEVGRAQLGRAAALLLLPDLFAWWLTGRRVAEVTNASTTGFLDNRERRWAPRVLEALAARTGVDVAALLPPLVEPGEVIGPVLDEILPGVRTAAGEPTPVFAVGSHDTASAVVAVPARVGTSEHPAAYVSCGTWSLVGLELDEPVLSEESRQANFTNELGVDGTVRYLKNVMGLWLLTQSQRQWEIDGEESDLGRLLAEAAREPALGCVIDANDPRLMPPGDLPARIRELATETGQEPPRTPAAVTRCILDSLALAYREAVRDASRLSGRQVERLHIVGGGAQNEQLCRLTADACGLPVVAGPVEATAIGNLGVQARALGLVPPGLAGIRELSEASADLVTYEPSGEIPPEAWDEAQARLVESRTTNSGG